MKNIQHLYKSTTGASVAAVCFQKQGGLLTVAMDNGQIAVLDSRRGFATVAEFDTGFGIAAAEVHPTEPLLAVAGQKKLEIRDMEKGRRVFHYQFDEGVGLGSSIVFHAASSRLFFGGYDYDIISVDYTAGDTEVVFTGADFNVCFALHPAGNIVASSYVIPQDGSGIGFFLCTPDGDAVQYDTPHIGIGAEVQPRIAFSADGRLLVAAYADLAAEQSEQDIRERGAILGTVQIYEFPSCRKVHTAVVKGESGTMEKSGAMYRPPDELSNIVLPGDGQYTACGTAAGTVVLIDNTTGNTEHVYRIGDTAVTALASVSETTFAAGCADGTVVLCECSDSVKKSAREVEPGVVEKEFLRLAEEGEW